MGSFPVLLQKLKGNENSDIIIRKKSTDIIIIVLKRWKEKELLGIAR